MVGIYKITNLINGKVYIGQSVDIESRFNKHRTAPFNKNSDSYNSHFYSAIRKYSLENFRFEIIEECTQAELDQKEEYWIAFYQSYVDPTKGYNETKGGQGVKGLGVKLNDNVVKEIQQLLLTTTLTQTDIAKQYGVSQRLISGINSGNSWHNDNLNYPLRASHGGQNVKQYHYCVDCGAIVTNTKALRCKACAQLQSRIITNRPSRQELKNLIRSKSFSAIGREFGVTDNAIRKWCEAENLPRTKKEIKQYTDEEWMLV